MSRAHLHTPSSRAKRRIPLLFLPAAFLFFVSPASAQVTTGTPPLGSFGGGPDVINLANLNSHIAIPVFHKPGRGMNFTYDLSYDSSIWYPVGANGNQSWQPVSNWGWRGQTEAGTGYISYNASVVFCYTNHIPTGSRTTITNWVYHDQWGVPHAFTGTAVQRGGTCGSFDTDFTSTATDGSGYTLTTNVANTPPGSVYTTAGKVILSPTNSTSGSGSSTDRNGNQITANSGGTFTDTLGATALTVSGTAPNNTTFTYTAPSGGSAVYTMKYTTLSVQTNFGCSNITEYPATSNNLVSEIDLPDGSKYTFTYEATPGHAGNVTGRLASVTLPTGGIISYSYTGGNNGIICADGSTATLGRTTPDGAWTYAHSESGTAWTTTVTDPQNNQTVLNFQGIYETQRQVYQGSTSGTLLLTTNTCYNLSASPCNGTAITLPITNRTVITTLPAPGSTNLVSKTSTTYNNVGVPTEIDTYGFGSGAPPSTLTRQTLITYAPLGNITAFRQTVTVKNSAGTILAQTNYNYDQTTPVAAPSNTPQLTSVSGSRGNLTSIQKCTNLSSCSAYLQTTMTYDTAGQLQTVKDPLNNQTSFSYADNFLDDDGSNPPSKAHAALGYPTDAYVTSITPPLNGAITLKYYYYNGAAAVTTDQNQNNSWRHFDSFGRPSSAYGPTLPIAGSPSPGNANPWTLINYTSPTQIDTYTDINDSSATAVSTCSVCRHDEAVVDGLGRTVNAYLKSDPEGQAEVDTAFDGLGRLKNSSHPYRSTNDTTYGIETPTYDAIGRTIKVTHQDTTYSQSAFGAAVTGTGVQTTQLCSSAAYGLGFPSLFTDESSKRREIWTDAFGRTIEADESDSTGALNSNTCYSYDPLGNLLQIVHGSQTRTYGYDTLSRVISVTIPELSNSSGTNCSVTYNYDGNSNVQTRIAPAPNQTSCSTTVTTTYYHDALNRLTKISYGATSPVATPTSQYAYDGNALSGCATTPPTLADSNPKGRMTSMCDGSGATSWAHDAAGRIITEKRTIQGTSAVTQTLSYSYNLDSSIATVTYPGGKTVTYTVSNAQRLTAAKDVANSVQFATAASYVPPGALSGVITGQISGGFTGISETHNYNNSLEYTSTKATSTAGTAMDLTVNYASSGDNGSITSIANNADNGRTENFTYDPLNRIASATTQATSGTDCWGQNFAPDALANLNAITSAQCSSNPLSVTVDGNNHITTSGFGYDAAGNMLQDGSGTGYSYSFDAENRLVKATGMTGGPYCYVYDANGFRVAKKSGANSDCTGGTVQRLYWRVLSGDALAETDGTGSTTNSAYTEYVFFAGRRIASRVGPSNGNSSIFYYFADQLGSVRTITTGSGSGQIPGQLCYDQDYTPYGQEVFTTSQMTRLQTTACSPTYKFTGYERDPETGLDYAFARYYSSRLGRFLSTDPLGGSVGSLQSNNAYSYVVNNPMNLIDPSGMHCIGSGWGHSSACPDSDGPCEPECSGGGGRGPGCGLDCLSGAGFAGTLGGGGYAGACPPEFQSCLPNGTGTFIGIEGNGIGYDIANDCGYLHSIDINTEDCGFETLFLFLPGDPQGAGSSGGACTTFKYGASMIHVYDEHIAPGNEYNKSKYDVQDANGFDTEGKKIAAVMGLNDYVFEHVSTPQVQYDSQGRVWAYAYTLNVPKGTTFLSWPDPNSPGTGMAIISVDIIGTLAGKLGGGPTNDATLVLDPNCNVRTSFPGKPTRTP